MRSIYEYLTGLLVGPRVFAQLTVPDGMIPNSYSGLEEELL